MTSIIWVIITCIILVLLVGLLFLLFLALACRIKKIRLQKLKQEYQSANTLPYKSKMAQIEKLTKHSVEVQEKYALWKIKFNHLKIGQWKEIAEFIEKINEKEIKINPIVFLFSYYRYLRNIQDFANNAKELFEELVNFTNTEIRLRVELSELQTMFSDIKNMYSKNHLNLTRVNKKVIKISENIELLISQTNTLMNKASYKEAEENIKNIKLGLLTFANIVKYIPKILVMLNTIIPKNMEKIKDKTNALKARGQMIDQNQLNILKAFSVKNLNLIENYCMDLQYKKAAALVNKSLKDIKVYDKKLSFEEQAFKMVEENYDNVSVIFNELNQINNDLQMIISRKQKDINISPAHQKLIAEKRLSWSKAKETYKLFRIEYEKKVKTVNGIDLLKGMKHLISMLLFEIKSITEKKELIESMKTKEDLQHDILWIKKWLLEVLEKEGDPLVQKSIYHANINLSEVKEKIKDLESHLKSYKIQEDSIQNNLSDIQKKIYVASNYYRSQIQISDRAEKAITLANRYRYSKKEYEPMLEQAESHYYSKDYERVLEITNQILNKETKKWG